MEKNLASKYSKWRQQAVDIKAGELKEVYFGNTNPNMFFISNFSDANIYGGLNRIPTAKSHEFIFRAHKQKPFGVPLGKRVLYLLNLSKIDVTVDVYSTEMEFDLNVLQDFSVDNVTITADDPVAFKLEGIVEGVAMDINTDKFTRDLFASIEGILKTISTNKNSEQFLEAIKNSNASLLETKATEATLQEIKSAMKVHTGGETDSNIPEASTAYTTGACSLIHHITNDSSSDLSISINTTGGSIVYTLKAGEILNDLPITNNGVTLSFADGTALKGNVRYLLLS